jgi:hypothetical protein
LAVTPLPSPLSLHAAAMREGMRRWPVGSTCECRAAASFRRTGFDVDSNVAGICDGEGVSANGP